MSHSDGNPEPDLDSQLRGLFQQAEQTIEGRAAAARRAEEDKDDARPADERAARAYLSLPQMLRPVVLGVEALSRVTGENSQLLGKLENKLDRASGNLAEANQSLPGVVDRLEEMLEQRNGVSQRMFDALHEELRSYKEHFVMHSVHKPIIRDLIALYDDLTAIHRQMFELAMAEGNPEALKTIAMNLEHNCGFIIEVLARLEVAPVLVSPEKHDRNTQRAVAVEPTDDPGEDGEISRSLKCGFTWKGRLFRPEEVVLKRWKPSAAPAVAAAH